MKTLMLILENIILKYMPSLIIDSYRKHNSHNDKFIHYSKRMVILFNYSIIGWLIIGLLQIPFSLFKDLDFVFGFLIMAMTPLTGFCTLIFLFYLLSLIWLWTKLESISLRIILRTIRIALKVIIIPLGGLFLILALLDLSDILKNVFPEEIAAGVAILGVGLILIGRKI